ncbi:MAG: purine-binding chemotaxis protein CheW [Bacteroidetes bacterium]|nr:purine-binding chemotaxis protein CheW [Bacteroidota bacterium]MCH8523152.1 chemotaxis protein CheW [Balneolales bacterium]
MEKRTTKKTFEAENSDGTLTTIFTMDGVRYGLDASLIQEVVRVGEITRVHNAPSDIIGVRNLRGKIITVIDLAAHLGTGCYKTGKNNRLILAESNGDAYGFMVDSVLEAIPVDYTSLLPATGNIPVKLEGRIKGLWRYNGDIVTIIDSKQFFIWQEGQVST